MLGAIAGDIIGSVYEQHPLKTKDFPLFNAQCCFTDDTVLTVAVAKAILDSKSHREGKNNHVGQEPNYLKAVWELGRRFPNAGYGGAFIQWLYSDNPQPYNSWGNGSAMRVSPIGFAFDTTETVLREAARSAAISHNHPEGIKGAQATALAVFLARTTHDKTMLKAEITKRFGYNLDKTVDSIRPYYSFDVSCQGTVPEAIVAFLDSVSYEDAIRNAISLGGDSDTLACITGGIAEAFYDGIPNDIAQETRARLPLELLAIAEAFRK